MRTPAATVTVALLLAGCGSSGQPARDTGDAGAGADSRDGTSDAADAMPPHGYSLPTFPDGKEFFILLPPDFSPFLPLSGEEATREPPGFYDPPSEHYFSYLFIWWLTGTPDLSTTALRDDLRNYYAGLCRSSSTTVTLGDPELSSSDGGATLVARRTGTLAAGNCFNNPVPAATIEASTYHCPDHEAVIVVVSPQSSSTTIRAELAAIRDGFSCW